MHSSSSQVDWPRSTVFLQNQHFGRRNSSHHAFSHTHIGRNRITALPPIAFFTMICLVAPQLSYPQNRSATAMVTDRTIFPIPFNRIRGTRLARLGKFEPWSMVAKADLK